MGNDRTQMAFDNSSAIVAPARAAPCPEKRINDAYVLDWVGIITPRTVANVSRVVRAPGSGPRRSE
jgi:hypothetical protein